MSGYSPTRNKIAKRQAKADAVSRLAQRLASPERPVQSLAYVSLIAIPERALASRAAPRITIRQIKDAVCKQFGFSHAALVSDWREPKLTRCRHVAIFLARELTGCSSPMIARESRLGWTAFGNEARKFDGAAA